MISVPKNTTIFSSKKIPRAFLIFLTFFLLTEWAIYSLRPVLINDYWNKIIINDSALIDAPTDYEYLIMGDSVQRTGIDPVLVNNKILNIGLPGGKPPSLYLLVNRYLKKHKAPKAIFLFVDPEDERDSLLVALRYFVSIPEAVSVWEDLTWEERKCFIMRYWASLDLRKTNLTVRDKYPYNNSIFVEMMKKNNGYVPSPSAEKIVSEDELSKKFDLDQKSIKISKRDMKYLDKLMKLAASKNIKIVFLGTLFPKKVYDVFESNGFNNSYLSFYEGLRSRYPEAYFVRNPILYLDNKCFGDTTHVNKAGSDIYTQYFKIQIFLPFIEREGK